VTSVTVVPHERQPDDEMALREMNSVLGKAQLILENFTAEDDSLSLSEIVRRTGLAKASVYRLSQELLHWGLLERVGSDYRLGLRLFEIGQRVPRQRILRHAALPFMEDLLLATQETIHFAIHDGLDVVYIEKIIMHRGLSKESRVAGRLPLYCTATGKIILAHSPNELLTQVAAAGLAPVTRHTVTSIQVLVQQIEKARRAGIATESEEIRLGYASVAVPVFSSDRTLAGALSITAPTSRMDVPRLVTRLRTAALGISQTLQAADVSRSLGHNRAAEVGAAR
jgi:DNA-binding IclR family transcriptional regulator